MNEKIFIEKLEKNLKGLSSEDRNEIIYDYKEHFTNGIAEGYTEEEIANKLGNPTSIAKIYRANCMLKIAKDKPSAYNIFRVLFAAISLSIFNFIFLFGPFIILLCILFSFWVVFVSISFSGIIIFIASFRLIFSSIQEGATAFFLGISMLTGGAFLCIIMVYLTKLIALLTLKYIQLNIEIIKGDDK